MEWIDILYPISTHHYKCKFIMGLCHYLCLLQFWLETDKAVYLLRQYFFSNLHDRLSTRPFLSLIEKKWLAFQVLYSHPQISFIQIFHLYFHMRCSFIVVLCFPDFLIVELARFVVQLLCAVKQSHDNGICHGEVIFQGSFFHQDNKIKTA